MGKITFLTQTLGCRVNQAETKQIADKLTYLGYRPFQGQGSPKAIIVNTCVVTQKGERESAKTIRHFKKKYPGSFLIATGCAANLWLKIKKEKKDQLPPADLFVTNEKKTTIPEIIAKHFPPPLALSGLAKKNTPFRYFAKIQDGCDRFCTYCLIPYLRTKLVSKKPHQIIKKINLAHQEGAQEAILCGINLSLYGQDLNPQQNFLSLVENILNKTAIPRLSLSSLTPELVNQKLIDIFINDQKNNQRLSAYWHLALQSASPAVLSRMNRKTNLKKLKKSLQYIKETFPFLTLRADIIVGFPQETDQEFEQTLNFIKETGISFGHLFPYSSRPKTTAEKMTKSGLWPEVSLNTKKSRRQKLDQVIKENKQEQAQNLINTTRKILILKETGWGWWGLSDNYWPVNITSNQKNHQRGLLGKISFVKITGFKNDILRGDLVGSN
jgi:threonylcarbamoyladenosine tRNA methylthiotransferase MtaB